MIERIQFPHATTGAAPPRCQYAALCWRIEKGRLLVLMVTTRRSGRWILPRGWPIAGLDPADCAAREAWEEAGVRGQVQPRCLGSYSYVKRREAAGTPPILVMTYALRVREMRGKFPEAGQRRRKWMTPDKAAALVREPGLARLLRDFAPRHLH